MHLGYILRGAHRILAPDGDTGGAAVRSRAAQAGRLSTFGRRHRRAYGVLAAVVSRSLRRLPIPPPAHAALGWPAVQSGEWNAVLAKFEAGLDRALTLASDEARASQPLTPPLEQDFLANYTTSDALVHIALHNAHHLGQVTTLRQQLGAWPPPSGSWTW